MPSHHLYPAFSLLVGLAALSSACGSPQPVDATTQATTESSGEAETSATTFGSSSTTDPSTTTDPGTTSDPGTTTDADSSTTTDPTGTTGSETTTSDDGSSDDGSSDTSTAESSGGLTLPDGEPCATDDECVSGYCFVAGLFGGLCGQCNTDADCAASTGGGCTIPNPIAMPPTPAQCNAGEIGAGCMSSDVCIPDLVCGILLDIPNAFVVSTCSECATDDDCDAADLCSPTIDLGTLGGQLSCVAPESQALATTCDLEGSGDAACASGFCAQADLGGVQIGVCSECEVDDDCAIGTCDAPYVDQGFVVVAGVCV